jgi:hypothetical protein
MYTQMCLVIFRKSQSHMVYNWSRTKVDMNIEKLQELVLEMKHIVMILRMVQTFLMIISIESVVFPTSYYQSTNDSFDH